MMKSVEAQGIFETTADLPADLFQVRLQHIFVEIFSCGLQIYNTNCKVCDCVVDCVKVRLIIGTFLDLLYEVLEIGQLPGYKSEVGCLGLQGSTKTSQGRTSLRIIRIATKLYVFIVLSIPSASGSPVSSWMYSSVSFSGLMEHLIAFTDLSCASQRVSLGFIILSWGWLTMACIPSVQKTS